MSSGRGTAGDSDSDYVPAQDGSSGDEDDEAPEFTRLIMQQLMALYRRGGRALGGDDDDDDDDDDGDDGAGHGNHRSGRQSARVADPTPEGTKHAFELEQAAQLESTPFGQTLRDASCPPPASLLFAVDPASTLVQVGIRDSARAEAGTGEGAGAGAGAGEEAAVAGTTSSVAMAVSFPPQSAMLTRTCDGLHTLQPSAACGSDPEIEVDSDAAAAAASPGSSKQPAPAAAAAAALPAAPAPTPANAPSLPKPAATASAAATTRTPAARGPGGRPVASTVRLLQARALGAVARLGPRRFVSSASSGNGAGGFGRVERAGLGCHFVPNQPENGAGQQVFADVGNGSRVYSGQFSASGDVFIAAWQNNQVMLLNTPSSSQGRWSLLKTVDCEDIRWTVTSTDVSPDEQFMIYSSITEVVHLCNIKGEYEIHEPLEVDSTGRQNGVWCAKFSPGGNEIICGTSSCHLLVYDVERKRMVERVPAHDDDINSVAYADRAYRPHLILTASDDHLVKVWDRRTMGKDRRPAGVLPGHSEGLTHVVGKGDGRYLLTNSKDQSAKLWDLRGMYSSTNFESLLLPEPRFNWDYRWMQYPGWGVPYKHPHDRSIMTYRGHRVLSTLIRCYFSPPATTGQRFVYSASQDGIVYVYDAVSGQIVNQLAKYGLGRQGAPVRDVSWHPHLPLLAASAFDGEVALWTHGTKDPSRSRGGSRAHNGRTLRSRRSWDSDDS